MFRLTARLKGRYQRMSSRYLGRRSFQMANSEPIISFTFDDFPRSAMLTGGEILGEFNIQGTFYASLGLAGKDTPTGRIFAIDDLAELVRTGHELGCHTYSHCDAWETNPKAFESAVLDNRRALKAILPTITFQSLSYPISPPRPATKRRVSKHFSTCRGGGQRFNQNRADANHLANFFLEQSRDDLSTIQRLIDLNSAARGWLILSTHDVCPNPTPYGCAPSLFAEVVRYAVASGAMILPVTRAWQSVTNGVRGHESPAAPASGKNEMR